MDLRKDVGKSPTVILRVSPRIYFSLLDEEEVELLFYLLDDVCMERIAALDYEELHSKLVRLGFTNQSDRKPFFQALLLG